MAPERNQARHVLLAGLAMWGLFCVPLLLVRAPPFVDWSNHQVRHWVQALGGSDPVIHSMYRFNWIMVPNLAADVVAYPFFLVFPPLVAGKLVLALVLGLWVLAPAVLYRSVWGHWHPWALLGGLAAYNFDLGMGFENFVLSAPVAVLGVALWVRSRSWPMAGRLISLVPVWFAIYFGHLYAWAIGGAVLLAVSISWLRTQPSSSWVREFGLVVACAAPGLAHAVWGLFGGAPSDGAVILWGSPGTKLVALMSPTFLFDPLGVLFLVALCLAPILAWLSGSSPRLWPHGRGALVLLAVAVAVVPYSIRGVSFNDARVTPILVCLAFAVTRVGRGDVAWRSGRLAVGVVLLAAARTVAVVPDWIAYDARAAALRDAWSHIPEGSRLLTVADTQERSDPRSWHMAVQAVFDRKAFVPNLFTWVQPLSVTAEYRLIDEAQPNPVYPAHLRAALLDPESLDFEAPWMRWWDDYDYVLALCAQERRCLEGVPMLTPVAGADGFMLYATTSGPLNRPEPAG